MLKSAFIGAALRAVVPLVLLGTAAQAQWRTRISGAEPVLPTKFTPMQRLKIVDPAAILSGAGTPFLGAAHAAVVAHAVPRPSAEPRPVAAPVVEPIALVPSDADEVAMPAASMPLGGIPLVDRRLSASQKAADLGAELQDAIARMEPIFDPTRLDGVAVKPRLAVWPGTASMDNVFADHWRMADTDANVHASVRTIAMAWHQKGTLPCDAFTKNRPHQFGDPSLTAMTDDDCARLARRQALGFSQPPAVPIVAAPLSLPMFAAPLPGARMSSQNFWALQRARMDAISQRLHHRWDTAAPPVLTDTIKDARLRP